MAATRIENKTTLFRVHVVESEFRPRKFDLSGRNVDISEFYYLCVDTVQIEYC